jgi:Septum formation
MFGNRNEGERRWLGAVTALGTAAVLILAGCGGAERDESGEITESGDVGVTELAIGDCVLLPEGAEGDVTDLEGVPCDTPHDGEVYVVDELPDGEYPGETQVLKQVEELCVADFEEFVGGSYETTELDITYLYPSTEDQWADDRGITCVVYHPGEKVTGSLKGQAAAHTLSLANYTVGTCINPPEGVPTEVVPCDEPHLFEVYVVGALAEGQYPGEAAVTEEVASTCEDAFAGYIGATYEASALDYVPVPPEADAWSAGDLSYVCLVGDAEGNALTSSVKGSGR